MTLNPSLFTSNYPFPIPYTIKDTQPQCQNKQMSNHAASQAVSPSFPPSSPHSTDRSQLKTRSDLHKGDPLGTTKIIHGLNTYISTPKGSSKGTLIFLPDIFGIYPNAKLLADEWAGQGYTALFPDVLEGDAIPVEMLSVSTTTYECLDMREYRELIRRDRRSRRIMPPRNKLRWRVKRRIRPRRWRQSVLGWSSIARRVSFYTFADSVRNNT